MFNLIQEILYYKDHGDQVVFTGYGGVFRGLLQDLKDIDHEGHVKLNHIVRCADETYNLHKIINSMPPGIKRDDQESLDNFHKYLGICFRWFSGAFEYNFDEEINNIVFQRD